MKKSLPLAIAGSVLLSPAFTTTAIADGHSQLSASIRIGLSYEETTTSDGDIVLRNFNSRIKWKGEKAVSEGLTAHGYYELQVDTDDVDRGTSGVDRTRQAWVGLSGDWGKVTAGAQYAAFYDMISRHTDQAWWGSCWTQFECRREAQVIKFSRESGNLSYAASITAADDADDDFDDQLEIGLNYKYGDYTFGIAQSMQADEEDVEGGSMLGLMASGDLGPIGLTLTYQDAEAAFAGAAEDVEHTTLHATYGSFYLVHNDASSESGDYSTLGYTMKLSDSALMYFEYQTISGADDADDDTLARAVMKYDF